jgi:hypothetical protein
MLARTVLSGESPFHDSWLGKDVLPFLFDEDLIIFSFSGVVGLA